MTGPRPGRLALAIVGFATALLEPGPVRSRYDEEFRGELWDLPWLRQQGHALGVLVRMPELRGALLEAGVLQFPHSTLWCRARLHHRWQATRTADGGPFKRCRDCRVDNDETFLVGRSDAVGVALRGPATCPPT